MIGVPGLAIQTAASFYPWPASEGLLGNLLIILGTVLLIVGLAYYARAKGHHPAWGLLGLVSIVGAIILGLMPDKTRHSSQPGIACSGGGEA